MGTDCQPADDDELDLTLGQGSRQRACFERGRLDHLARDRRDANRVSSRLILICSSTR
jgi:hypothetical protein